ncbi:MAG: hypothetical protein V2A79_09710 [Planctomycetota bacterium]
MANSAQRRKSIRQQNETMRKALEKLRRKLSPAQTAGTGAAAAEAAGGAVGQEAAAAAGGAAGAPAGMDMLKKILGGKGGGSALKAGATGVIGYMLIEGLLRTLLQGGQQLSQTALAGSELEAQGEALTPEAVREQALQPVTRSQRDFALQLLMQQLSGGRGMPTKLARGEVLT